MRVSRVPRPAAPRRCLIRHQPLKQCLHLRRALQLGAQRSDLALVDDQWAAFEFALGVVGGEADGILALLLALLVLEQLERWSVQATHDGGLFHNRASAPEQGKRAGDSSSGHDASRFRDRQAGRPVRGNGCHRLITMYHRT